VVIRINVSVQPPVKPGAKVLDARDGGAGFLFENKWPRSLAMKSDLVLAIKRLQEEEACAVEYFGWDACG
jgi:hypothetical protein